MLGIITKNNILLLAVTLVLTSFNSLSFAGDVQKEVNISGTKISDFGGSYGVGGNYRINPKWRVGLNYSKLNYSNTRRIGTVNFSEELKQDQLTFSVDWFPWDDKGHYATLAMLNVHGDNQVKISVDDNLFYRLNGQQYSGTDLGSVTGTIETADYLPYLGIGHTHYFGNPKKAGWHVQADIGVVFNLSSKLTLSTADLADLTLLSNLRADLDAVAAEEEAKLEDELAIYRLSFGYRF